MNKLIIVSVTLLLAGCTDVRTSIEHSKPPKNDRFEVTDIRTPDQDHSFMDVVHDKQEDVYCYRTTGLYLGLIFSGIQNISMSCVRGK